MYSKIILSTVDFFDFSLVLRFLKNDGFEKRSMARGITSQNAGLGTRSIIVKRVITPVISRLFQMNMAFKF
jgi:hypothetical protein